ncbi:MAG: hypothetical protein C5B58_16330 [Acidobacteria bacterium]|nr:MAG: hypothetical protein C5B58_16330 [Acidobacteriota bacterium]
MRNEIAKTQSKAIDGFDAFEDGVEGEEERGSSQNPFVKFTNDASYVLKDGTELSPQLELLVTDIGREVVKFGDGEVLDRIVLEPGQKFPNVEKLNEETPKSEWRKGPSGELRGPWQAQHLVHLLNMATMEQYTFATSTIGGHIAVRDLVDKTRWMRKFRGENVFPVVTLADTFMHTRFGGRQRPHFLIKRWVTFGGGLPETATPAITGPAPPVAAVTAAVPEESVNVKVVQPPTAKEVTKDEIPW